MSGSNSNFLNLLKLQKEDLLDSLSMFENMYKLLLAAEKIRITLLDGKVYNLFAWKSENGIGGWLCELSGKRRAGIRLG